MKCRMKCCKCRMKCRMTCRMKCVSIGYSAVSVVCKCRMKPRMKCRMKYRMTCRMKWATGAYIYIYRLVGNRSLYIYTYSIPYAKNPWAQNTRFQNPLKKYSGCLTHWQMLTNQE